MLKEISVTLLHFNGWPDLDVPTEPESIEGFNALVSLLLSFYATNQGKAVMHCRMGKGRTGTTLTILSRLLQAVGLQADQLDIPVASGPNVLRRG